MHDFQSVSFDAAGNASRGRGLTGTGQVRRFRIAGKVLYIESVPAKNFRDGRLNSSSLVWIKVE
jgi:hypothetical protein